MVRIHPPPPVEGPPGNRRPFFAAGGEVWQRVGLTGGGEGGIVAGKAVGTPRGRRNRNIQTQGRDDENQGEQRGVVGGAAEGAVGDQSEESDAGAVERAAAGRGRRVGTDGDGHGHHGARQGGGRGARRRRGDVAGETPVRGGPGFGRRLGGNHGGRGKHGENRGREVQVHGQGDRGGRVPSAAGGRGDEVVPAGAGGAEGDAQVGVVRGDAGPEPSAAVQRAAEFRGGEGERGGDGQPPPGAGSRSWRGPRRLRWWSR